MIVSLYGASGLFEQLRDSVNAIWGVKPLARGIRQIVLSKLTAFLGVLVGGAMIVAWVLFDAWLHYVRHHYSLTLPFQFPVWQVASFIGTCALTTPAFALTFKLLPCKELRWRDVWLPAVITGLLFAIGKFVLGWYLSLSTSNASYGTAAALIVILLWAYYSSQIFFFGVELSEQYATQYGSLKGQGQDHENKVLPTGVTEVSGEKLEAL